MRMSIFSRIRVRTAIVVAVVVAVAAVLVHPVEAQNCDEGQQKKMQQEFSACLNKFTQQYHDVSEKAKTAKEIQVSNPPNSGAHHERSRPF